MAYEYSINNFYLVYKKYNTNINLLKELQDANLHYIMQFNTKLRMPLAIEEIFLSSVFLDSKSGNLKELHKFLYKLTDLWFAYESFFLLYEKLNNTKLAKNFSKILWLSNSAFNVYLTNVIKETVNYANADLQDSFKGKEDSLNNYFVKIEQYSTKGQKNRISSIISKNIQNLNVVDFLTITYAIRNNYVHNGETTITNPGIDLISYLDIGDKLNLVKICYDFLVILVLDTTNTLIEVYLNSV